MAPFRSSITTREGGLSIANRSVKHSHLAPMNVRPFCLGNVTGARLSKINFVGISRINEDGVTDGSKRRKVKKFVTIVVDNAIVGEVRNISSTVEEYVLNAFGDEDEV